MNPQNYTINIRPGWGISQVVKVSQGDVGRPLTFTIMDGQDALTIASGTTVTIKGTKPSTLGFTQTCELSGNTASVETTATMTQEAGAVQAELILTQGTTVIGSANFVIYVEPAAHPEGTTDGDAETARDLMTRAQAAVEQAEAEADRAEEAAESASQTGISTAGATAGQVPTANGAGGWRWQDQHGGGGTSDDIENKSSVSGATVTGALNSLNDQIANLQGSAAPTIANTVSEMVDTTKIYLYVGTEEGYEKGYWYYYNGTAWVYGGRYSQDQAVFSTSQKAMLISILRNAVYSTDQSGAIDDLELSFQKAVTSISAVFNAGGSTIYSDDTLDTLRQYLTVTAVYEDSSAATVTGYTLDGNLTVGTCTITVVYQDVTDTFTVTVAQAVPRYTITNTLTGVINSNTATNIPEGNAYTATLTATSEGYAVVNVIVTMGGNDITETAYTSGTVSIANVTGNITITAEAIYDTSPVIAKVGTTWESGGEHTANKGYGITKWYVNAGFDREAQEAHVKWDAENQYFSAAGWAPNITVYCPNTKTLEAGYSAPSGSHSAKQVWGVDETFGNYSSFTWGAASQLNFAQRNSTRAVSANCFSFTLALYDLDDAYAYLNNPTSGMLLPEGMDGGDIIFAGKNTKYYGMHNISEYTGE